MSANTLICYVLERLVHGDENAAELTVYDIDRRRWLKAVISKLPLIAHPNDALDELDYEGRSSYRQETIQKIMTPLVDVLSSSVTAIYFTDNAEIVSVSTNSEEDMNQLVFYPPLSEWHMGGRNIKTILRSELTELRRFGPLADLVSYNENNIEKRVVFKYAMQTFEATTAMWHRAHIHLALPPHPNFPPIDRLVLEEITQEGVVGVTTRFIPGGTFCENRSRVFKLKWLRQLIAAIDDLNLSYGLMHQDITDRNILVDEATDTIQVIDFSEAIRIGDEAYYNNERFLPELNDVKGVIIFLNCMITANPQYINCRLKFVTEPDISNPTLWVKHPDVQLDHEVGDFLQQLTKWTTKRRSGTQLTHYTQAPNYLEWPHEFPARPRESVLLPPAEWTGWPTFSRQEMLDLGRPYIGWVRPPTCKLDSKRRLLATGRYADEKGYEAGFDIDAVKAEIAAKSPPASPVSLSNFFLDEEEFHCKKRKAPNDELSGGSNGANVMGPRTRARARAEKERNSSAVSE